MPDLNFEVVDAPRLRLLPRSQCLFSNCASTTLWDQERIFTVTLRCQIQINVTRRRYSPEAQARLLEVFGKPKRWGETLRPLLWTHTSTVVPQFSGSTIVDLPVPCTYDFEVAGTKYFDALEGVAIPLTFLFSGTIFYEDESDNLQVGQISQIRREPAYRLPVALWPEMIGRYFPNSA